jgi:hypothetical protein
MKSIVFDTGPIISLSTNNLLWILDPLKKRFNGRFCITNAVKGELVNRPLGIKKYKFEAIQVEKLIEDGILEIVDSDFIREKTQSWLSLSNSIFQAYGNSISIVHFAEISVLAAARELNSDAVAIDEKTTRFMIESPMLMQETLRRTLHTRISTIEKNLREFSGIVRGMKVLRSVELVSIAYELGILDKYITNLPDARKNLLESVLWGVKLNGCAVSRDEITEIIGMEIK